MTSPRSMIGLNDRRKTYMKNVNLEALAEETFERLSSISFENCYPLSRELLNIPTAPALYAVRHQIEGVLYLGMATKLRQRFKGGHKVFLCNLLGVLGLLQP